MGKNQRGDKDLAKEFFGDSEFDWEDEVSEEGEKLPIAPPPPPVYSPPPSELEEAWGDKFAAAPADGGELSSAPTLVFSSIPTLPPEPAPDLDELHRLAGVAPPSTPKAPPVDLGLSDEEVEISLDLDDESAEDLPIPPPAPTQLPTPDVPPSGPSSIGEVVQKDPPTLEVDPTSEEVGRFEAAAQPSAPPPAPPLPVADVEWPPEPSEEVVYYGDDLDAQASEPMVRTVDPPPSRGSRPAPSVSDGASFTPPVGAPAAHERGLVDDQDAWREAAAHLVEEATVDSPRRGALLYDAAKIHLERLSEPDRAETLFRDAASAGHSDPELHVSLSGLAIARGQWPQAILELEAAANKLKGRASAEAWQEAALLAGQRTGDSKKAATLLGKAVTADSTDYAALSLLRDYLAELGRAEERADVLGRLAKLAGTGHLSAEASWEQGCILHQLSRDPEARQSFREAREASPPHTSALLALEALLIAAEDDVGLGELYLQEADRKGQVDQAWWLLKAARALRDAGDPSGASKAYARAAATEDGLARREHHAWLEAQGDYRALAESLEAVLGDDAHPHLLFRLGWIYERRLNTLEPAAEAYKRAAIAAPGAEPVIEAVVRTLTGLGRDQEVVQFLAERLPATEEGARAALLVTLGEAAQRSGDLEGAKAHYVGAAVLGAQVDDPLQDLCRELEDWQGVAEVEIRRSERAASPFEKASALVRAAEVLGTPQGSSEPVADADAASAHLQAAWEACAHHPDALERWVVHLCAEKRYADAASALVHTADQVQDPTRKAGLLYRAARLYADKAGEADAANQTLAAVLELVPGHSGAIRALRQLGGGDAALLHDLFTREAARSSAPEHWGWARFLAALVAEDVQDVDAVSELREVLALQPDHPGALAALEGKILANDNRNALVALCRSGAEAASPDDKGHFLARLADVQLELDEVEGATQTLQQVCDLEGVKRPLRAASTVARAVPAWELAASLLAGSDQLEHKLERAWILSRKLKQTNEALEIYRSLIEEHGDNEALALGAARVAQQLSVRELMIRANGALAEHAASESVQLAYALWTAALLEEDEHYGAASGFFQKALELAPSSRSAFRGARRTHIKASDAEALTELYGRYRADDLAGLAQALERAGALEQAEEAWGQAVTADAGLAASVGLERVLVRREAWREVYEVLQQRREAVKAPATQAAIDARLRWLLREKLADTDEAWELYKDLHAKAPDDREITEALARIASARGETALGVQYLGELAERATDPADAARYRCGIGEAYEQAGDVASARQAFLDALDHVSDDRSALDGLKRLAETEGDHAAFVAVLQREAALASGERQVEVLEQIARHTEEKLEDRPVAMDAWRTVLEKQPANAEALERMMGLSEQLGEWGAYVEHGNALAQLRQGEQRARLLREVGVACEEHLERDDALRYFERAIEVDPPDPIAAQRLAGLYRANGDWSGAVRVLILQSALAEEVADKVRALDEAARIHAEIRHDREAAGTLYATVLDLEPDHEGALRFQASHLFEAGAFDEALPVCERLEPIVEQGQDLEDFDTRIELSQFYFYYAQMLALSEGADAALQRYERALELNPTHLATLEAVGPLYVQTENWKRAERVYRQLLQLSGGQGDRKKVASTYTQLGLVERRLDSHDKAYKRFNKALEVFPNHIGALQGMALVLGDREEWSTLLNVYNNVIYHATEPGDVIDAYMNKGRILDDCMNRPDKASQHYERSLAFDPNQPVALLHLAELAMRRGDFMEAGSLAQRGLQLAPEAGALRSDLLLIHAASRKYAADIRAAQGGLSEAIEGSPELKHDLADKPLEDLETLGQVIKARVAAHLSSPQA